MITELELCSQYFNNYVFSAKRVGILSRNVYSSIEVQLSGYRNQNAENCEKSTVVTW